MRFAILLTYAAAVCALPAITTNIQASSESSALITRDTTAIQQQQQTDATQKAEWGPFGFFSLWNPFAWLPFSPISPFNPFNFFNIFSPYNFFNFLNPFKWFSGFGGGAAESSPIIQIVLRTAQEHGLVGQDGTVNQAAVTEFYKNTTAVVELYKSLPAQLTAEALKTKKD